MSYLIYSTLHIFLYVPFFDTFPVSVGHEWDTHVPIHLQCSYFSSNPLCYMTGVTLLLYWHMSKKIQQNVKIWLEGMKITLKSQYINP